MKRKIFFSEERYLETTGSTNNILKSRDCNDRTLIYTFDQTAGRGRNGREWKNFKDRSIALSVIFKDAGVPRDPLWFTAAFSVALVRYLKKNKIKNTRIKWPNDVYVGNKKIAGILTESVWKKGKLDSVVVGIGINVNASLEDLRDFENRATSIFAETERKRDIRKTYEKFRKELEASLRPLVLENNVVRIRKYWLENCRFAGEKALWKHDGNEISGTVKDILADGTLIFVSNGRTHKINSGEIELV
jgi:BirA family transcriptional regulator, biotin operon repressor / biotin---[acetyl-CoA-carboxylase] ligase